MKQQTLLQFKEGEILKIIKIDCEGSLSQRLAALGMFDGSEAIIVKNDNFGPLILQILNSKIALSRIEANKIYGEKL